MKNDPRRSFWRAAGPLLGFWGIQLVMEFVIEFIIILPFMGEASSRMTQSGEVLNYQEMMNKYYEVLSPAFDKIIGGQIAIAGIATAATLFLTVTLFVIDRKKEQIAGIQRMGVQKPLKNYWSLFVMGVIGSIGATCLSAMAQAVLVDPEYIQTAQNMYSADFVVQIIVFGFVIPIAEEFMFRGVLYQRYRETRGFYYAAIWSALFFSVTHTNTVQMIYTFLLGILLCYIYEKFGSMKAPIMLHVVLNLGSLIFTDIGVFKWLAREPFKMAVAVIISTFICAACFVWIQRSGDPVSTQKTVE